MEFDTNVNLKKLEDFSVTSCKTEEDFLHEIWRICEKRGSNIGYAGNGEFWIDYSSALKTKYISCKVTEINLTEDQKNHQYNIVLKGGAKAGRINDIIIILLALFAFWCLSKLFVPNSETIHTIGFIASIAIITGMIIFSGKAFGRDEAANLMYEIENIK